MKLEVIVVSYRTPDDLFAFLASLDAIQDEIEFSLTVVNVDPTDDDKDVAARANLDRYIEFPTNVGYATAVNEAASMSESPYLGIFNADVELWPGVLARCVEALEQNPTWGVVGPRQVDESNLITCAGTFGTLAEPKMRGWHEFDQGQYNDVRDDAVHVSGSAMFWRREAWDELTECPIFQSVAPGAKGALLPTKHLFEETAALYHCTMHGPQSGWRVAYLGTACCIHRWHRASPVGGFADQLYPESQAYFREFCDAHALPHD